MAAVTQDASNTEETSQVKFFPKDELVLDELESSDSDMHLTDSSASSTTSSYLSEGSLKSTKHKSTKQQSQTKHQHYELNESEFGTLTSNKYKYIQRQDMSKPVINPPEDKPHPWVYHSTIFGWLFLIVIGHIRDFFAKIMDDPDSRHLKEYNGYAPLTSDFDSFYTRRLKHRLDDCFNRPTTGVPGRYLTYLERYTPDFFYTYLPTGRQVQCLNLASYNYLGFAQSVGQCTDAAEEAINHYGVIAGGTRVAGGFSDAHVVSEKVVADFVGKEDAVIYSQGYSTNSVIFSSLVDKDCLVISDELNHASIRFGIRMSGASLKVFKHNNLKKLEQILRKEISGGKPRTHRPWKKILIVVEGLYSMEGTICDLPGLLELKKKYKFYLFVDEAHSIGAMGPKGRGVCDYFGISPNKVDILMGTLTKSFGATGGYIAADKAIVDRVKCAGLGSVYSENSAPPVLAQINSSLQTITGQADKKAAPVSGFSSFFGGGSSYRFEEAAELYIQAANAYRLQKDGRAAGQTFEKAAAAQQKTDSKDEAANTLVEAYKAYKQTDPEDAARVLSQAVHLFTLRGAFRRAAGYQMDLGSIYENDLGNVELAVEAYEKAGDWYFEDQAEALANKAFIKVADLAALNGNYAKSVEKYEQVAKQSLNNQLTKWSLKDYFLKAGLCHIAAQDLVAAERALNQYIEWEPTFATTRECQLLHDVIATVKEGDEKQFSAKLYEYDQFSQLDKWKTAILLKIKGNIEAAEDDIL